MGTSNNVRAYGSLYGTQFAVPLPGHRRRLPPRTCYASRNGCGCPTDPFCDCQQCQNQGCDTFTRVLYRPNYYCKSCKDDNKKPKVTVNAKSRSCQKCENFKCSGNCKWCPRCRHWKSSLVEPLNNDRNRELTCQPCRSRRFHEEHDQQEERGLDSKSQPDWVHDVNQDDPGLNIIPMGLTEGSLPKDEYDYQDDPSPKKVSESSWLSKTAKKFRGWLGM